MRKPTTREVDLAAEVVAWLQAQEWTVYQEVACVGKVCDIVAERVGVIWTIECKTSFNLAVIEQAHDWARFAHYRSVAVPALYKRPRGYTRKYRVARRGFAVKICEDYGIGLITVGSEDPYEPALREELRPRLSRRISHLLKDALRPEHQTWAKAGNAEGKRFTPFQKTKQLVQALARDHSGIELGEMINRLDHHYATDRSARNSLRQLIERGVIGGVGLRAEGRKLFVVSTEVAP